MSGLLDFLQSASNTAASNVSAPVDGIAWLLRKAGVPVGDAPVGGSDWMAQNGLTRPVQQSGASLAGETLGLLAPIVAAAKAPQIAGGLLQMADNAMAPRTLNPETGAIVWHGSPHKFDKFDSGKIGTGEGAQAYGNGLYLAESPDVAKGYADVGLHNTRPTSQSNMFNGGFFTDGVFKDGKSTGDFTVKTLYKETGKTFKSLSEAERYANELNNVGENLYKVDLPDEHIAKMLDWDKPLSEQTPEVRKLAEKFGYPLDRTGGDFQRWSSSPSGGVSINLRGPRDRSGLDKQSADMFSQAGIPGIRYLDGGSRGAGTGTSNYVIFPQNEDILTILERNGKGLLGQ